MKSVFYAAILFPSSFYLGQVSYLHLTIECYRLHYEGGVAEREEENDRKRGEGGCYIWVGTTYVNNSYIKLILIRNGKNEIIN